MSRIAGLKRASQGNQIPLRVSCISLPGAGIGDGGPAAQAVFNTPTAVAADRSGNLYISDTDAGLVRKIDPKGIVSTIAGTGLPGYTGDAGPATAAELTAWGRGFDGAGALYVTDPLNNVIRLLKPSGQ